MATLRTEDTLAGDAPAVQSLQIELDLVGRAGGTGRPLSVTVAAVWLAAARAYMRLRRWEDALQCIRSAAVVDPACADVYCAVRGLMWRMWRWLFVCARA
jgi:hypothetical protein